MYFNSRSRFLGLFLGVIGFALLSSRCTSFEPKPTFDPKSKPQHAKFDLEKLTIVSPKGPYAHVLKFCAENRSCPLAMLPFLGQETPHPNLQDILNRTLTQNQNALEQFEGLLRLLPEEDLLLFRSVRVVIITEISESLQTATFFSDYALLSFQFLDKDPGFLDRPYGWINPLNETLGLPSKTYELCSRYPATVRLKSSSAKTSQFVRILYLTSLYHELGHAQDNFPSSLLVTYDRNKTPLELATAHSIAERFPLASKKLQLLIKHQTNLSMKEIAEEFQKDQAVTFYSYANPWEDAAELFTDIMLLYRFGIERENLIFRYETPPVAGQNMEKAPVKLVWGAENRVLALELREKALAIGNAFFPEIAWSNVFSHFSAKSSLRPLPTLD